MYWNAPIGADPNLLSFSKGKEHSLFILHAHQKWWAIS